MRWLKRALRAVFLALLLALGAALFFLLVIMGDSPPEAAARGAAVSEIASGVEGVQMPLAQSKIFL
jgi:hypothetical protein